MTTGGFDASQGKFMIKKGIVAMCVMWVALGLLTGCSKETRINSQAFDAASPEIKELWDKSLAADKVNDYVTALSGYQQIIFQKSKLTAPQSKLLDTTVMAIRQRMYAATMNGDEAAKAATLKLMQMQSAP